MVLTLEPLPFSQPLPQLTLWLLALFSDTARNTKRTCRFLQLSWACQSRTRKHFAPSGGAQAFKHKAQSGVRFEITSRSQAHLPVVVSALPSTAAGFCCS